MTRLESDFPRRSFIRSVIALAAASQLTSLHAQDLPVGTGRIVVPFPSGGPADTLARLLAEGLTTSLSRTFVVDNKPGATGNIGAAEVARSKPDGLTLLLTNTGLVMNPYLHTKMKVVDPFTELTPVSAMGTTAFALVIPASATEKDFAQWTAMARKSEKPIAYGSFGIGSSNHLHGHALGDVLNVKFDHVPYKGDGQALTDLASGRLGFGFFAVGSVQALVRSGRLKAIAVTGDERSKLLPELPTMGELGIDGYGLGGWLGLLAPANTPASIVDAISVATVNTLARPEVQAKLSAFGIELFGTTPARFAEMMRIESERQGARIKSSGASLD